MTEFVRYRLGDKVGKPIRGILYTSARPENGTGYVLFVSHEDIARLFRSEQAPFKLLPQLTRTVSVDTSKK